MGWGCVDVSDGGRATSHIGVAQGSDLIVVQLFDPFGGPVLPFSDVNLEGGVMVAVFDVPGGGDTEGVLVIFDLFVEVGDGVVKGIDGGLVRLFPRFDGGSEGANDVDQQHDAVVVEVSLGDEGSATRGKGGPNEIRIIKHGTGMEEPEPFASGLGGMG
jgi:hypothetical protein